VNEALPILDLMAKAKLIGSKSEGRRLIEQGGVRLDGEQVVDIKMPVAVPKGKERIIQVGKRKFLRVIPG
jgi:tyrosyl-tRNA synthetase